MLDVVVFGATGFVGRLVARYLADHAPDGVRIGLAGRSAKRLAAVRAGLGKPASAWPLVVADSADPASLRALAEATRVVATTVGPYARYGLPPVEACARAGTDYVDLCGEVLFMRDSIDQCDAAAVATGTRIVHSCGIDSIPSDLGVLLLHTTTEADGNGDLADTTLVVTVFKGGFSGGTLASISEQVQEVRRSAERRRIVLDPYALSPDRAAEPVLGDERDRWGVRYDGELGLWVGPFVMATTNSRVVRRSNALQDWAYGRRFRYREVFGFGTGVTAAVRASAASAGLGALMAGLAFGPARALLKGVLPAPGEGPGEQKRRSGSFRMEIATHTSTGTPYVCRVAGKGDPGYAVSSLMLAESALCLALDRDRLPSRAGVLTPATGMGLTLVDRLRAAGLTFQTQRHGPGEDVRDSGSPR